MAILLNDNIKILAPKPPIEGLKVLDNAARNALDNRWAGMIVYNEDRGDGLSEWQYLNLTSGEDLADNSYWEPLGSSAGSVNEAPIDGEQYARKDGTWQVIESGGGAFIPLTGTEVGSPVTGDIEIGDSVRIYVQSGEGGFYIGNSSANEACLQVGESGDIKVLVIGGVGTNAGTSRGLTAHQDFTGNITTYDYVQKKYVDELISDALFIPTSGTTSGNDISGILKFGTIGTIISWWDNSLGFERYIQAINSGLNFTDDYDGSYIKIDTYENGIISDNYYGAKYVDNSFIQKKYVDENFVGEALVDGKLYARKDGDWVEAGLEQVLNSGNTLTTEQDIIFANNTTSSIKNSYNSIDFENFGITLIANAFTKIVGFSDSTTYFDLDIYSAGSKSLTIENVDSINFSSRYLDINNSGGSNILSNDEYTLALGNLDAPLAINGSAIEITTEDFKVLDGNSRGITIYDADMEVSLSSILTYSDITYDSGTGPVIYSPNQTAYRITVDNSGALSAELV